jgi:hypothetical protein
MFRNRNDKKLGVIPRHEESLEVLFMFIFGIFGSSWDASYVSMTAAPIYVIGRHEGSLEVGGLYCFNKKIMELQKKQKGTKDYITER